MTKIPSLVIPSVAPDPRSASAITREFHRLLDGDHRLKPAGRAKRRPRELLRRGYTPRYRVDLFDTTFYLSNIRQNPDIRFFVAYVVQPHTKDVFPRLFYKDVSLIWRSATHFIRSDDENWIGKGDCRITDLGRDEYVESAEETTDLPLEMQSALEELARRPRRVPRDEVALELVLRRGPNDRIEPYRDFSEPRRRAMADPANRINGLRPIARFTRKDDPTSLVFVPGYEPDFASAMPEDESKSRMYGGILRRFRVLSANREIQYLFFAGPQQVWIIPPQATTTELSSYGVRTVDVICDENLCIPGYEYHFLDDLEDPPVFVSQIPEGFAGPLSEHDQSRADASPWLDRLPVVQDFRRKVLGRLR